MVQENRVVGEPAGLGAELVVLTDVTGVYEDPDDEALQGEKPWACMMSFIGPHSSKDAHIDLVNEYLAMDLPLPASRHHDLVDRPEVYRLAQKPFRGLSDEDHRKWRACYYAAVEEHDRLFGELLDQVEAAGQFVEWDRPAFHRQSAGTARVCRFRLPAIRGGHAPRVGARPVVAPVSESRTFKRAPRLRASMFPLATTGEPLPIAETGAVVLIVSLLLAVGWVLYLYR